MNGSVTRIVVLLAPFLHAGSASLAEGDPACDNCETNVPAGNVINETWTVEGSPYCVRGDITVGALTIGPGVCVLVDGPYTIEVATTIVAIGTESEPIVFTEKDPDDNWQGLFFHDSGLGSVLEYCCITNSTNSGVRIDIGLGPFGTRW